MPTRYAMAGDPETTAEELNKFIAENFTEKDICRTLAIIFSLDMAMEANLVADGSPENFIKFIRKIRREMGITVQFISTSTEEN